MKPEKKKSFGGPMRTPPASQLFCDGGWDLSPHPFQAATNVPEWKNLGETRKLFLCPVWLSQTFSMDSYFTWFQLIPASFK